MQQQEAANNVNEETTSVEMMRIMGLVTLGSIKVSSEKQECRNVWPCRGDRQADLFRGLHINRLAGTGCGDRAARSGEKSGGDDN